MKFLSSLLTASAALLLFSACDSVSPDESFVVVDPNEFEPQRTVLVEEFTGQLCPNCPRAHALMANLESKFNSSDRMGIITVGIHVPVYGSNVPKGMVTIEAATDELYGRDFSTAPAARINRRRSSPITTIDQWTGAILSELTRKSPVEFTELTADLNHDNTITISGKVHSSENIDDTKVQLWLVEDDIVMPQISDGIGVPDYNHHSVFRAAINGVNGQSIDLQEKKETPFHVANFPLAEYVNPENIRVVAFVYSDADGVLNARQCNAVKVGGGIQIVP